MAIVEELPEQSPAVPPVSTSQSPKLPHEFAYITSAFTPDQEPASRSKAYLGVRTAFPPKDGEEGDPGTERLAQTFSSAVKRISEPNEEDVVAGLSFLSALFQVDWQSAASLFSQEAVLAALVDAIDLYSSDSVSREIARLFSQASGHKSCRTTIPKDCVQWLDTIMNRAKDRSLRALAAMAVVKLTRGAKSDAASLPQVAPIRTDNVDQELVSLIKELILNGGQDSLSDAVEGLAYLSTEPAVKEALARDKQFLTHVFSLAAPRKGADTPPPSHTFLYGVIMIIVNLSAYRPRLSAEDAQIQKLRRMAKAGTKPSEACVESPEDTLDDDDHVRRRGHTVAKSGGLNVLAGAVRTADSDGIRLTVGQALLFLAEDKENRGLILQSGGARALVEIIRRALPIASTSSSEPQEPDPAVLIPIQALAKLAITASPIQVFGPTSGAIYDSIRPFSMLLLHQSSSLLQRFEAMMALTNVSSHSAEAADRVAKAKGLISKVEFLMLEDHTLIRRAATELLCNLMAGSEDAFERYTGDGKSESAKSRLHIFLALSDVQDPPTRLAASGALAILTASPHACKLLYALEENRHRVLRTFIQLLDPTLLGEENKDQEKSGVLVPTLPDPGLVHRGAPSRKAGKKVTVGPKKSAPTKVQKADWKEGFKKKSVGVSDMTLLTTISNESINENLEKRWKAGDIYTWIGGVLISVNPFRDLGIYTDDVLRRYQGKNRLEVPPHVFSIAETAYYNMNAYHENQCVIISGESGAGKTEAAKRIMQYIAAVSGGQDSSIQQIKDMVLATNPLLESFGCAKTLRNNNSSRHGKYLEIMFNNRGEPIGAQITNYLLEKARVVGQVANERNFHIFYQFAKAASPEQREYFGIQGPDSYSYTADSDCLEVEGINDVKDFAETMQAMQVIGLTDDEQNGILRMLSAILWLGNIKYNERDDGNAEVADQGTVDFIAYLLEVDPALVQKVLTTKVVETQRGGRRGSVYDVPLNPAQAAAGRDALSKAIYNNLFEWIVSRINISMKPRQTTAQLIGILDNSFEQLCINYVNEKLQQIFIELTLKTEQEEYVREQIQWTPIKYFNNKIVCDLIEEKRPPGIFAALNDATATAHADPAAADQSFIQRTAGLASNPHFEARGAKFVVKHYAGDVTYNVAGMTDKNKDALVKDILDLISVSSNQFLQGLFPERPDPNSKKRPPSAGDRIKASAGALVENLSRAQPSYIRTIKPNQNRSATEYDDKAVLHQVKYLGLQENIRVRRAGFAYRNTFEKMIERFYLLSPNTSYAGEYTWTGDARSGCETILKDTGIAREEWQMGVTKAFIKNPETLFALETMRDRYWHNMARRIQRAFRNYMRYKQECARRIQRFWKNNKEAIVYAQKRDYGHQILADRKERRRFSLLSYRRFMGDYLDLNGNGALGSELKSACGIGSEEVMFSARGQILVSKLGRSSKPSPRFLIVTNKAFHICITTAKDGVAVTSLERKIPLVTIRSVGMSNLRDDWFVFNTNASEEGDPILHCYFKTELTAVLMQLTQASIQLLIGPTIDYAKKKDKRAQVKFVKDETVQKDDTYKSHTVHVPSGEPPNSRSRPPAKRKAGVVRPITQGKLLRKGGPSGGGSSRPAAVAKPKPAVRPLPNGGAAAATRATPAPPNRAPVAPPPPLPPAEPDYPFEGQEGEMSLAKDDVVELIEKQGDWWLVKKGSIEGWAPHNYLELVPPKPKAPHPPPPPPPAARRAGLAAAPKPAAATKPSAAPTPKVVVQSLTADASAKPVSVFPGMKPAAAANGGSSDSTPANSRPSTSLGGGVKPPPPPIAGKKPGPPPVAAKPGAPKPPTAPRPGGAAAAGLPKPPIPTAARPAPATAPRPSGGVKPSGSAPGQLDLSAILARRAQQG
ncbi:microfilament motor [Vararia minispora EC-137]|uniref:Microfilament motor n=1 Tax=Vararia minispora EC-137 TaxID=1314806 RepID=A0ACB8QRB9_9AGAM|nr:microfilament motor [Vararia minispora EC-137]